MSFHLTCFAIFISLWASISIILLTAGALTDLHQLATTSNMCTTDARLGGVGGCPLPQTKILATPVGPGMIGNKYAVHSCLMFHVDLTKYAKTAPLFDFCINHKMGLCITFILNFQMTTTGVFFGNYCRITQIIKWNVIKNVVKFDLNWLPSSGVVCRDKWSMHISVCGHSCRCWQVLIDRKSVCLFQCADTGRCLTFTVPVAVIS